MDVNSNVWRFNHVQFKSWKKYHSYSTMKMGNVPAISFEPRARMPANMQPANSARFSPFFTETRALAYSNNAKI